MAGPLRALTRRLADLEKVAGAPQLRVENARRAARHILDSLPLMDEADGFGHTPLTDIEKAGIHDACRRAQNLPPIGTPP